MGRNRGTLDIEREFRAAENMMLSPTHRSRVRHELMDHAERTDDHEMWERIGHMLLAAFRIGDMTPQHSDHFVDGCPNEVFLRFANEPPAGRFKGWHHRAVDMGLRKNSSPKKKRARPRAEIAEGSRFTFNEDGTLDGVVTSE